MTSDNGLDVSDAFSVPITLTPYEEEGQRIARVAVARTSDRGLFKACRRRWNWQSPLRGNREPLYSASPLWLGSGFHFALEDFHGYKHFPTAAAALQAYHDAWKRFPQGELPDDELMCEAVLTNGEFMGVLGHFLDHGDAEVMAVFDQAARAVGADRDAAIARVRAMAADGRLVSRDAFEYSRPRIRQI